MKKLLLLALWPMLLFGDEPKTPPVPERVIAAREKLATGEVVEMLEKRADERWYVRGEKKPFAGTVTDKIQGRAQQTAYRNGALHGPYTTWHKNGVASSKGEHHEGKRVRHQEWDNNGGQLELREWNLDGTPKKGG